MRNCKIIGDSKQKYWKQNSWVVSYKKEGSPLYFLHSIKNSVYTSQSTTPQHNLHSQLFSATCSNTPLSRKPSLRQTHQIVQHSHAGYHPSTHLQTSNRFNYTLFEGCHKTPTSMTHLFSTVFLLEAGAHLVQHISSAGLISTKTSYPAAKVLTTLSIS